MKYVLDTNIFSRALMRDHERMFQECSRLFEALKSNKVQAYVPGVVLSELVWLLSSHYAVPREDIVRSLKSVVWIKGLSISDTYDYAYALNWYYQNRAPFIDCLIATAALRLGATVLSYDKDYRRLQVDWVKPNSLLEKL
ncbi:PIN domain-containing protein [candidate division WWE3 bacterium]|nr:PIN domain-containing protein [candidate division WWE3 bacterium]